MTLLSVGHLSLPIDDPLLKFLLELIIILGAPLLLNKIKVPHLLGLIIAGALVGPNGFHLLARDSSVVVTGTTGLLYIMFLAGLEIDMGDFKKNKWKSLAFSAYTFAIPFGLGLIGGYYVLGFNLLTTVLFSSLFSSHTLIVYPYISKMGISKNPAVNITLGGTMVTDVLSLLVLAVVVGMTQGDVGAGFWAQLSIGMVLFVLVVLLVFPLIARWFFKRVEDKISQYIFVLVMIYLASLLAEVAGVEAIIGAFFAGLALNQLIPRTSTLMNRVEFVGNALFIPFFLISVGMLIDFKVFFRGWETLGVAAVMLVASIGGKYLAAVATRKSLRLTRDEGMLIFGMSTASAAATLASVMVGYNIILSETATGEPVRLLNEHVLNGSILLILISCVISSFVSLASARRIAEADNENTVSGNSQEYEHILLAMNHGETVEKMVNLGLLVKGKPAGNKLFALSVIDNDKNESAVKNAEKILHAAADVALTPLTRYDNDVVSGIGNVIKEQKITDVMFVLQDEKGFSPSFVYNLHNGYLRNDHVNVLIYHPAQPVATIKKYTVLIPPRAEMEPGFFHALLRVWNIGRNSGVKMVFYAGAATRKVLERILSKASLEAEIREWQHWREAEGIAAEVGQDEALVALMARQGTPSFAQEMRRFPDFLNLRLKERTYLLIFPFADEDGQVEKRSVSN
ncbi:cation:proton antiporter, partial [Chitinophaga sp.]|uniref:cation:proton antiporter n=2 Tax=Chitinophaga TaxID=79328 RepID=UPI002FDEE78F